jgi:hypothetical protein
MNTTKDNYFEKELEIEVLRPGDVSHISTLVILSTRDPYPTGKIITFLLI